MKYFEEFLKFESENDLFNREIRGFKYWHYIRFNLYREILKQKENVSEAHTNLLNKSYIKRVWLKLKQFSNFISKSPIWRLEEKDILVFNHERRVKNGEYYECIYTDTILEKLGHSYLVLEEPILEKHFEPIRTNNIRYLDYLGFRVAIYREFMKKTGIFRMSYEEKIQIKNIIDDLNKKIDVNIEIDKVIDIVAKVFLSYKASIKYYKKILDKVKPKVVVELVSYGGVSRFIINELAKDRGIKVVELQHGTMGKYHIAYNFLGNINLKTFPDYIFLFGQFWKDNTRLPIEDSKIKVVGWPYYEQRINMNRNNKEKSDKNVILFISQGLIGEHLSKKAVELSKKINLDEYKIIYKLHPGEYARWKEDYPWLNSSDIEIVDKNLHDMHYYFAKADIQVGVSSTAIFEGIGYGLKTIVFKLPSHEYLEELYQKDLAYLVESVDELLLFINRDFNPIANNSEYFWEKNSVMNIKKYINEIIYKGEY